MTRLRATVLLAVLSLSPGLAAQDMTLRFRFVGDPGNIQGCIGADSAFTRVHTLTRKGDVVEIRSSGGIDDHMKPTGPDTYATVFQLGLGHLDVTADLGATKAVTIVGKSSGCKWSAKFE